MKSGSLGAPTPNCNVLQANVLCGRFPTRDEVAVLVEAGVTVFVNLAEEWEFCENRRQRAIDYSVPETLEKLFFPVMDRSIPEDKTKFRAFVELLSQKVSAHTIYVHCLGGAGRTGIVAACLLLQLDKSLSADDALNQVDKSFKSREFYNGGTSPEFEHQREFVREFKTQIA